VQYNAAQQSVHPTRGILRHFQAFFWLWVFPALKPCPHSAHTRVTQPVRRFKTAFHFKEKYVQYQKGKLVSETTSTIKQFHSLATAIAFISECVESNSALALFNQSVLIERQSEQFVERPDHFIEFTFPELQRQFQVMDFRIRYKDSSFPDNTEIFKLGGHDKELGHTHIDFLRRGDDWVIDKIWQCR
jgi:hypothetical protein